MKKESLVKEMMYMHDIGLINLTIEALNNTPDGFFTAAASSSGLHHPAYARGTGGLVRHTQAAVHLCNTINKATQTAFPKWKQDCMLSALILHDTCKFGLDGSAKHTIHEHPNLVRELLSFEAEPDTNGKKFYWNYISNLISSHMGQWRSKKNSSIELAAVKSQEQAIVHFCDYLASRKSLSINIFDEKPDVVKEDLSFNPLKLIKDESLNEMMQHVLRVCRDERITYSKYLSKTVYLAKLLLSLDTCLCGEYEKDLVISALMLKGLNKNWSVSDMSGNGPDMISMNKVLGYTESEPKTWVSFFCVMCEAIAHDETIEIVKESSNESKDVTFKPATEKQVNRLKCLFEEAERSGDNQYKNFDFSSLSCGSAGALIGKLKALYAPA